MSKIKDKFEKHYTKSGFYAMNNVKGITLTTLVITIVVLLILASVATFTGIEAIENTKRTKFIAELKIMQSYVNQWYEDCKPSVNATEYDKQFATNVKTKFTINGNVAVNATSSEPLVSDKVAQAQSSLNNANVKPKYHGNFYILEESQLQALGVEGVSQSVLVSVQDRKVVSYLGLKYKNKMYYTIDSLDGENGIDAIYNVGYENPNKGQPSFKVKSECTGPSVSKITVYDIDYNTGYNTKWKVYYKKDYDTNWQTSDDLSFVVTSDGVYTIKLTNQNGDIVGTTTTEIGAFAYKKQNSTLASSTDKNTMTSKNPVIPQGFKAVDTDTAKWKYTNSNYNEIQGWNDGLVIEDDIGNQFVWVPCTMGTSTDVVTYSKNFSYPSNYSPSDLNTANAFDTTTVDGVKYSAIPVRENKQIFDYGGFYVARFEAGLPTETLEQSAELNNVYTSIPVSKYGSKLWNYIDYNHSYVAAEKMINNTAKYGKNKSGLITGTQWDTIMQWYEKNNIPVLKSNQDWGTYRNKTYDMSGLYFTFNGSSVLNWINSISPATEKITHTANSSNISASNLAYYHASGLNTNNYQKNIADMAGNIWEWTAENTGELKVPRGGNANDVSSSFPSSSRSYVGQHDIIYRRRLPTSPIHPRRATKRICYGRLTCLL